MILSMLRMKLHTNEACNNSARALLPEGQDYSCATFAKRIIVRHNRNGDKHNASAQLHTIDTDMIG